MTYILLGILKSAQIKVYQYHELQIAEIYVYTEKYDFHSEIDRRLQSMRDQ